MEWPSSSRNAEHSRRPVSGDVLVLGELLLELSCLGPLGRSSSFELSFSGDALNSAAAAAAGGATVSIIARVGDDELGEALLEHLHARGIDTSLIHLVDRPNGMYLLGADPDGVREFVYLRSGSAGSLLEPADVEVEVIESARSLVISGIACAISDTAAAAAYRAAELMHEHGGIVVYDPNFRPKLMSPAQAQAAFATLAPFVDYVTPSWPNDAQALFPGADPAETAVAARQAGASVALVTLGSDGLLLDSGEGSLYYPAVLSDARVDATGAGDVLVGMLTARLTMGDDLDSSVRLGMAAASLSVGGRGGTGKITPLEEVRLVSAESKLATASADWKTNRNAAISNAI
jgi:2-dehydro-3-deoxygluconokinase